MNICNKLTISRIFLAFICIGLIIKNSFSSLILAFIVFIIASITDFLDGYWARKRKLISDLGKLLDPIADKILISGVFIAFLEVGIINAWMVSVIMLREFIITGMRLYGLNRGGVLEARALGKHKTVSQIIGVVLIFIALISFKITRGGMVDFLYYRLVPLVMWYIVIITLFSGMSYLWVNRKAIKTF